MKFFGKISGGVIVQKQPYPGMGFIEIPAHAVCGMSDDGQGGYVAPAPVVDAAQEAAINLAASDQKMARVSEDLIDVLIVKGVIALADLPTLAQATINNRKGRRAQLP